MAMMERTANGEHPVVSVTDKDDALPVDGGVTEKDVWTSTTSTLESSPSSKNCKETTDAIGHSSDKKKEKKSNDKDTDDGDTQAKSVGRTRHQNSKSPRRNKNGTASPPKVAALFSRSQVVLRQARLHPFLGQAIANEADTETGNKKKMSFSKSSLLSSASSSSSSPSFMSSLRRTVTNENGHRDSSSEDNVHKNKDPFNIYKRFVETQEYMFDRALHELQQGRKRSCWLWFILPTAPYIVDGVERGSNMNRHFSLRSDEEVMAYLRTTHRFFDPDSRSSNEKVVDLRSNYMEIAKVVEEQLKDGNTMDHLFGSMDGVKAVSSFRLFERISALMDDMELNTLCHSVLDLVESKPKTKPTTKKSKNVRLVRADSA